MPAQDSESNTVILLPNICASSLTHECYFLAPALIIPNRVHCSLDKKPRRFLFTSGSTWRILECCNTLFQN